MDSQLPDSSQAGAPRPSLLPRLLDWLTWPRIILCSLCCAVIVGAHVYLTVPLEFTSRTSVLFSDQPDAITALQAAALASGAGGGGGGGAAALGLLGANNGAQRFQEMLQSRRFRATLIEKYDLTKRYGASAQKVDKILGSQITVRPMGQTTVLGQGGNLGLTVTVTCPAGPRLAMLRGKPVAFTVAEAREICARMANDAPLFMDEYSTRSSVQAAHKNSEFIAKRMVLAEATLARTQQQLIVLQRQYRLLSPESKVTELTDAVRALVQARTEAQTAIGNSQAGLAKSREWLPRQTATRIQTAVTTRNPIIAKIQENLVDLEGKLAAARASGKLADHPDVQELEAGVKASQAQLATIQGEVEQQVVRGTNAVHDTILNGVIEREVALAGAQGRLRVLDRNLAQVQEQSLALPPVAQEYVSLARRAQSQADLVALLANRLELARLEEERETSGKFQVLDAAEPPEVKSGPSTVKQAMAAFLLATMLLGAAWAYRQGIFKDFLGTDHLG